MAHGTMQAVQEDIFQVDRLSIKENRDVAQLARARRSGRRGRRFKSSHPDQLKINIVRTAKFSRHLMGMKMPRLLRRTQNATSVSFLMIRGRIDDKLCRRILRASLGLQQRGISRMHLLLSSNGGSMRAATDLYHALKAMPYEIVSWNMGMIGSAANLVYLAGSVRVTVPEGRFLLHPASKSFPSSQRLRENNLERALSTVREQQEIFQSIVERETGMSHDQFMELRGGERLIAPEEALQLNLAQEIDMPRITHKTTVLRFLEGDA